MRRILGSKERIWPLPDQVIWLLPDQVIRNCWPWVMLIFQRPPCRWCWIMILVTLETVPDQVIIRERTWSANLLLVSVARVSTLFLRGCEMAEGRTSSIFCSHLRVMFTFLLSSNWYLFCSYCYSSGTVTSDKSIIIMTKSGLLEWKSEITRVLEIPWTDTKKTLSGGGGRHDRPTQRQSNA